MIVAPQRRGPESNTCSCCRSSARLECWLYRGDGRRQDPQLRTEGPELLKLTVHSHSLRPLRPGHWPNQTAAANRSTAAKHTPASGSPRDLFEGRICAACQTRNTIRPTNVRDYTTHSANGKEAI